MNLEFDKTIARAIKDQKYICILSLPRAGSTALAETIANKFNVINYGEIFHADFDEVISKPSIVKLTLFGDPQKRDIEHFLKNRKHCCVINLQRQNTSAQVASYLMAVRDKQWHSDETPPKANHDYLLDHPNTKNLMRGMYHRSEWIEQYESASDLVVYYEDLVEYNYFKTHHTKLQKDETVRRQFEIKYYEMLKELQYE